jgi:hypothetical protein
MENINTIGFINNYLAQGKMVEKANGQNLWVNF